MLHHTCTIEGICKPCEALTEAWLTKHDPRIDELPLGGMRDAYSVGGDKRVSLDALTEDSNEVRADWLADPARRYDTARDAMRTALRMATSDAAPAPARAATTEVLDSIRRAVRWGHADGVATVGDTLDSIRPAMGRADAKASAAVIRAAYEVARVEASEAYSPARPTGEIGWKVATRSDLRCLASPAVVATGGMVAFIVNSDGEAWRSVLDATPVAIARTMVEHHGKGEDRERIEWTDVLTRQPNADAIARTLTIRCARTEGTTWSPDASTFAADRFVEALEPRGAVRKSSSNKRKRDGRIGGSAVITSAPGRGAR